MDLERNVVDRLLRLIATGFQISACDGILRFELEVLRERLAQRGSADGKGVSALIDDVRPGWDWSVCRAAETALGNGDELGVCHRENSAVIPQRRKIRASGYIFGVLLLLHLKFGNAHDVIAAQSKLHGFLQRDAARRCLIASLLGQDAEGGEND